MDAYAQFYCAPHPCHASIPLHQSDDEGLDLLEQIVARIVIYFHGDRLAQIQAENAQNGLGVHHMDPRRRDTY